MSDPSKVDDAILSFTLGENEKAITILRKISEESPECIDAWRALAEVNLAIGEVSLAEDACRQALEIDPKDLTSMVSLARILVRKGDKKGAEEASAKARILGWQDELAQEKEEL